MPSTSTQIAELIANPREALAVELKGWIDPAKPEGMAKIVRAAIALRNNNGGYLIVGIDDMMVIQQNGPADPRATFHPDIVQALVSKYASQQFEVHVHFPASQGQVLPVIEVESGVVSPVAAKADIYSGKERLLHKDRVYVRTLSANNVVSTSEATWQDWEKLVNTCFLNREADIGAFFRRQLSGITPHVLHALRQSLVSVSTDVPDGRDEPLEFLEDGRKRFEDALVARKLEEVPPHGSWEFAFRIIPAPQASPIDDKMLGRLLTSNPRYTGWPAWTDTRGNAKAESQPRVLDGGWQALILGSTWYHHIDFWRIQPEGFYLRRGLQEDLAVGEDAPIPLTIFDFSLPIWRVAAIAVALGFARLLCPNPEKAMAEVICRWTSLSGRELRSWGDREFHIRPGRIAQQSDIVTRASIGCDTPVTNIAGTVDQLVAPLLNLFDGFSLSEQQYEDFVQRVLSRTR